VKLKGKVAFITGFGSGLGQAIAVMFAKEGAAVAGTSTTESKGRETVAMVEQVGGKALFRAGDVGNSAQMKALIEETVEQFGGLDIVVNSAGVRTNGSITEITEGDWDRTLDANLKGAFIVSRLAIPQMKKRGGGVILHIAARSGILGQSGRVPGTDAHPDGGHVDAREAGSIYNQSTYRADRRAGGCGLCSVVFSF